MLHRYLLHKRSNSYLYIYNINIKVFLQVIPVYGRTRPSLDRPRPVQPLRFPTPGMADTVIHPSMSRFWTAVPVPGTAGSPTFGLYRFGIFYLNHMPWKDKVGLHIGRSYIACGFLNFRQISMKVGRLLIVFSLDKFKILKETYSLSIHHVARCNRTDIDQSLDHQAACSDQS